MLKSKRRIMRVSKEYSGIAIFLVFMLLITDIAFSPQNGGMPRVYSQAYSPLTISASSLPIAPTEPVSEWLDMLSWTQTNLNSTTIVCSWWDYGYWLGIVGNVTTLADNATVNATQIENIGFIFLAPEEDALKMLKTYDAEYILVFITLQIGESSTQQGTYVASFSRFGDEAKWSWMARISGQARQRLIDSGFMNSGAAWTDENNFGAPNNQTGAWEWNDMGKNSTIYKLMSHAKERWVEETGILYGVTTGEQAALPEYFSETYFAGLNLNPIDAQSKYGGLIPMVALYKIDWQKYYNATSQP